MKISTLIISNKESTNKTLENLILKTIELDLIEICNTGKKAIERIKAIEPNLIFLDTKLKDMSSFDLLDKINQNKKPIIIFISIDESFALKAFDYFAFDYLLKPLKHERLLKSIKNAIEYIKKVNTIDSIKKKRKGKKHFKSKLVIKLKNKALFLEMNEIKYITASGYYAEIHINDKKHLLRESLTGLIDRLDSNQFIRIHRSTIINVNFIAELIHSNYGEIDLKTMDNKTFRISKSYKKKFQSLITY